jgi:hypothetical protein
MVSFFITSMLFLSCIVLVGGETDERMNLMLSGGLDVPNWGQNIKMTFAESINPQKCTVEIPSPPAILLCLS